MPTLLDLVQLSPQRAYQSFLNPASSAFNYSATTINSCNIIRDTLVEAGWKYVGATYASVTLSAPFGWGFLSFQAVVAQFDGYAFVYYDPSYQAPPSGMFDGNTIIPVPITGDAQGNLVASLNGTLSPDWTAIASGPFQIVITATTFLPGTLGDGFLLDGNGSIAIGGLSTGGGWLMQSIPQMQVDGFGNTATIDLVATTGVENLAIKMTIGSFSRTFFLGVSVDTDPWILAASSYQALFFCAQTDPLQLFAFNNFLWACTPVIPKTLPLTFAAFIAQPNDLPTQSNLGSNSGEYVDQWVDTSLTQLTQAGQLSWSVVFQHSEGEPFCDPLLNAVFQAALLSMYDPEATPTPESRIVAYLPDCFVSSFSSTMWQQIFQEGFYWRCVATQDNPPGSLWMADAETAGGAGPPPPPHTFATGTVNVTIFEVDWVSGQKFDPAWAGLTIMLNGVAYIVSAVNPDGLVLSITLPYVNPGGGDSASNIPYSVQLT